MVEQPNEHECKLRFAYYMHKLGNALDAMAQLAQDHGWSEPSFIIATAKRWQLDPIVEEEVERLNSIPPKKNAVSKLLWDKLTSRQIEDSDAARVARVLAEIEGWIAKPATAGDSKRNGEDKLAELAAMIVEPVEETPIEVVVDAPAKEPTNGQLQP